MTSENKPQLTRWGCRHRADRREARDCLIDAAVRCYDKLGIQHTFLTDIAREAKVTRQTIYRYFRDQREILKAVILRDLERFWRGIVQESPAAASFEDYLTEVLLNALDYATHNPDEWIAFRREILPILHEVLLEDGHQALELIDMLRLHMRRLPGVSIAALDIDALVIGEWLSRMLASYLAKPNPLFKTREEQRRLFRRLLPALNQHGDQPTAAAQAVSMP